MSRVNAKRMRSEMKNVEWDEFDYGEAANVVEKLTGAFDTLDVQIGCTTKAHLAKMSQDDLDAREQEIAEAKDDVVQSIIDLVLMLEINVD